ncbi:hypothetical protein [Candidatus Colwellia aromaticivorans]|uniref:hypothetical protein n=1 Tax=Candidatus Colwellia aromaticivorans TaxID=2267621 RepID=UPI000DF36671|nr:hypothetical protein [Candidatus Colwellia aromaticivorans]
MALYSWFSKNNNKPNKKSVRANNNLLKASESAKYIENYTMWPTAKIKPGIEVTLPVYDEAEDKSAKDSNKAESMLADKSVPLEIALITTK